MAKQAKKKRWFKIIAPRLFQGQQMGETTALEEEKLLGRPMKVNLMTLTGDPKKQNTNAHFQVVKVDGLNAVTQITGIVMAPAAIRRFIRRNKDRLDSSLLCKTSDNNEIQIKPLVITRNRCRGSLKTDLRHKINDEVAKIIKKTSVENLFRDVVSKKFQNSVKAALNDMCPIAVCDIRSIKLLSKPQPDKPKKAAPKKQEA